MILIILFAPNLAKGRYKRNWPTVKCLVIKSNTVSYKKSENVHPVWNEIRSKFTYYKTNNQNVLSIMQTIFRKSF